jgi:uncharacterized phage protein (TIGR01671 family)
MNRVIKFRVWDIELHMWINNLGMGKNNTLTKGTEKRFHVMQFSGLHDKNGHEIYEGDIICSDKYNSWEWRGVIKFSHGAFGAEILSTEKKQSMIGIWGQKHNLRKLDDDIVERLVVIGNIYETPHLLTKPT